MRPDDGVDLTLALLWQNYHIVHHLYPSIPFYRYGVVRGRSSRRKWMIGAAVAEEMVLHGCRL